MFIWFNCSKIFEFNNADSFIFFLEKELSIILKSSAKTVLSKYSNVFSLSIYLVLILNNDDLEKSAAPKSTPTYLVAFSLTYELYIAEINSIYLLSDAVSNQDPNKMTNSSENIAFTKNGASYASNHHLPLAASDVGSVSASYKTSLGT